MNTLTSTLGRIWRSGIAGKTGIGCLGLLVFLCACGTLGNLIGPPQTAQTTATPIAQASTQPTAEPSPTATIEPTVEPSPTAEPTIAPTTAPTDVPPTSTPSADLTVPTYARQVAGPVGEISDGLQGFVDLMQNPKPGDTSWQVDVAVQITKIRTGHETLTKIENVPPVAQPAHDRLLDATGDCDEATRKFTSGMDNNNVAELGEAGTLMQSCGTGIFEAQQILQRAATP